LVKVTDLVWLDPVVAIFLGINILWTSRALIKNAVSGLMEAADPKETAQIIQLLDEARENGVIGGFHQLRHRRINDQVFIEYHVTFPAEDTILVAHDKSHQVEDAIHRLFSIDSVVVTAHLEPATHSEAHKHWTPEPTTDPLSGDQP